MESDLASRFSSSLVLGDSFHWDEEDMMILLLLFVCEELDAVQLLLIGKRRKQVIGRMMNKVATRLKSMRWITIVICLRSICILINDNDIEVENENLASVKKLSTLNTLRMNSIAKGKIGDATKAGGLQ